MFPKNIEGNLISLRNYIMILMPFKQGLKKQHSKRQKVISLKNTKKTIIKQRNYYLMRKKLKKQV